ncbi:MAG: hypothetical protein HY553_08325 [Elusimicrobia bacterium]|nr:hypothetical protein [Elusimicrobiota bacterium]
MTTALSTLLLFASLASAEEGRPPAEGSAPPAAKAAAPAPAAGSAAAMAISIGSTVEEIYLGASKRDPFLSVAGTAAKAVAPKDGEVALPPGMMAEEDFSIHGLEVKGVMEDRTGGFAILIDPKFGASFVLRRGRLFDVRNKPVPGVTGSVKAKQKSVTLIGPDRDKRVLTMAEKEEDGAPGDAKDKKQ